MPPPLPQPKVMVNLNLSSIPDPPRLRYLTVRVRKQEITCSKDQSHVAYTTGSEEVLDQTRDQFTFPRSAWRNFYS